MNLIKTIVVTVLFSLSMSANASDLSKSARAVWPDEAETATDVVNYLVNPFGYRVVLNNAAGRAVSTIQPHLLRDPYNVRPVNELILQIIPSDIGIKIDEQNKLIQFHFVQEMMGASQ